MAKKLSAEEFAEKAAEILHDSISKLPEDEQDRRIAAFEQAVNEACSSRAKEQRTNQTRGFLARTLQRVGLR